VRLVESSKRSQGVGSARVGVGGRVQALQGIAGIGSPFAAPVLQGPRGLSAVERWLTVADVAGRLGVSTATVYGLCKRGELQHVRVANAIRVSEDALAYFAHRPRADGGAPASKR
jgi:excisionase family DNA binding protein